MRIIRLWFGQRGVETSVKKAIMKPPNSDTPMLLDAIDRRILAALQEDGRMTNVELSQRAGISAPPCLRRVRALEEAGVIRGYHADTDPQKLGWEITFFAIVGLDSQKEAVLSAFEQLVGGWPEVRECHMIRGGGDFLLKLVARDTAHENQLTQRLTGAADGQPGADAADDPHQPPAGRRAAVGIRSRSHAGPARHTGPVPMIAACA